MKFHVGRRVIRWIVHRPSWVFALLYILTIPAFAFQYSRWPLDFYHSTAAYDPAVQAEAARLGGLLETVVRDDYYKRFNPAFLKILEPTGVPRRHLPPRLSVELSPGAVRIVCLVPTAPDSNDPAIEIVRVTLGINRTAEMRLDLSSWIPGSTDFLVYIPATLIAPASFEDKINRFFPCDNGRAGPCIRLKESLWLEVRALTETAAGVPSPLQNNYMTMLYFSAVTLATLGYGDIVPISTRARSVVTLQIVLGPILIGLFLNALFRENRR